jgi:NADH-quinone oxidoreductase subunit K
MVGPVHYLVLAAALFAMGAIGVVVRRNAIIVLMSIELMLNAVNLTFLAFSRFPIVLRAVDGPVQGHAAVFYVIAVAAAEAAVGLAIVIAVFRSRLTVNVDEIDTLKN